MSSNKTKRSLLKIAVWLIAEIILNFIGLDDLADYSEFVLEKRLFNYQVAIVEECTGYVSDEWNWLSNLDLTYPKFTYLYPYQCD